jgi:hypothetical protein
MNDFRGVRVNAGAACDIVSIVTHRTQCTRANSQNDVI